MGRIRQAQETPNSQDSAVTTTTTTARAKKTKSGNGKPASTDKFRDRIVEFRRIRCGDIVPHPKNPRGHGKRQLSLVKGLLEDIGKCKPLLAFPADGLGAAGDFSKLMYYDGHGRQVIDKNETWPVCVTDLTRREADDMLFNGDALAELADYDAKQAYALLDGLEARSEEQASFYQEMMSQFQTELAIARGGDPSVDSAFSDFVPKDGEGTPDDDDDDSNNDDASPNDNVGEEAGDNSETDDSNSVTKRCPTCGQPMPRRED